MCISENDSLSRQEIKKHIKHLTNRIHKLCLRDTCIRILQTTERKEYNVQAYVHLKGLMTDFKGSLKRC